jgi:hypothetical protein
MTTHAADPAVADLAVVYAGTRSLADLARLRDAVRSSPGFDAGVDVIGTVSPAMARGDFAAAVAAVRALMPGAFFSPSAHAALGAAHAALGDEARAEAERRTQVLALESIRSTGDGTRDRPWSVLRISDQYDVLRADRRVPREQTLLVVDGRSLDRHLCEDGSEAWFEVSRLVGA